MKSKKEETTLNKTTPLPPLEEMLANVPKEAFELTEEDRQFLNSTVGKEIIKY